MTVNILVGDCRTLMAAMEPESIDSCVCDPPYELTQARRRKPAPYVEGSPYSRHRVGFNGDNRPLKGFMGNEWDGTGVAFDPETWAAVYRVLKPGAHLVAFSGTRTYHRMVCAIEDAGFEVRDQLAWIYGSGFPKSHNQPGGWGTALKPAWEPICLARKPLIGTVAANVLEHGTGAINIDGCRVEAQGRPLIESRAEPSVSTFGDGLNGSRHAGQTDLGRWPANIIHDGSEEVLAGFPAANGGHHPAARGKGGIGNDGHKGQDLLIERFSDEGSAARFFYTAKAAASERGEGNNHPTVKPLDLMRWLCRLVTPKGGLILDPFAGSGSTLIAADREQFNAIGCELSEEYAAIARRRIESDRGGLLDAMEAA